MEYLLFWYSLGTCIVHGVGQPGTLGEQVHGVDDLLLGGAIDQLPVQNKQIKLSADQ